MRLVDQGWTDALRHLHPGERIDTFRGYFRNAYARDAGLRIDHFLLSTEAAARLSRSEVDKHVRGWDYSTSDNSPVWIVLDDKPLKKRKMRASQRVTADCLVGPARQISIRSRTRRAHAPE